MSATTPISLGSRRIAGASVYLVDTDVISEARKGERANRGVRAFFATARRDADKPTCPS